MMYGTCRITEGEEWGLNVGLASQHGLGIRNDWQKHMKASENNGLEGKHI